MSLNIEVEGLDEAIQGVIKIANGIRAVSPEALIKIAQDIVSAAKDYAPVRTGKLRASIGIKDSDENSVTVGASAPYAGFVEYGTVRMSARPFMRPAIILGAHDYPQLLFSGLVKLD